MNAKRIVNYKITGQAKNESDPKHFLTLGMRGRPKLEIAKGNWFSITGSTRDDVFENIQDLQILKESLREAIAKCNCSRIKIEVSLLLD